MQKKKPVSSTERKVGPARADKRQNMRKTAAVIVTYNPDTNFRERLRAIHRECHAVYIVDNGSAGASLTALRKAAKESASTLISLGKNTGIAHAQNVGMERAFAAGADGIVLFDHDSKPQVGFTAALWRTYLRAKTPAIVGGNIFDINKRAFSRYPVYGGLFFRRVHCPPTGVVENALMAIASGSMISREVYARIGSMLEPMFIDYVDWEYCLRAWQMHKIGSVICGAAVLEHARGERKPRRFLFFTVHPAGYSKTRLEHLFTNRGRLLRANFFHNRAFVAFEVIALLRDFTLLLFEQSAWSKIWLACRRWCYGFCSRF